MIDGASLDVLENTGLLVKSRRILETLESAGACADYVGERVKIPRSVVRNALEKAPSQFELFGRNGRGGIVIGNGEIHYGLGGTPPLYFVDLRMGEMRQPTKHDVAESTRLGDALQNIEFIMTIAGAYDVPSELHFLHECEAIFANTTKPVIYPAPGAQNAQELLEMASAIAGSEAELQRRPIISLYSETASPLCFSKDNEDMLQFALAGVPITLGPLPLCGATAPITLAGACVIANAENLAAIALIENTRPVRL